MPGKTVWIGGGLVLAIGAVAYLSYHEIAGCQGCGRDHRRGEARAD